MKPHKYFEVKQQQSLITRGSGIAIYNIRSHANALNTHWTIIGQSRTSLQYSCVSQWVHVSCFPQFNLLSHACLFCSSFFTFEVNHSFGTYWSFNEHNVYETKGRPKINMHEVETRKGEDKKKKKKEGGREVASKDNKQDVFYLSCQITCTQSSL